MMAGQVDELSDIGCCTRDRYHERNAGIGNRCLKLSMTDGAQRVFGIEYRPIPQLQVLAPAGLKIGLRNVCVRRGLLLLVPEIVVVLGGVVQELEEARQRIVQHANKPPRGIRNLNNNAPARLAERLTAVAWTLSDVQPEGTAEAAQPFEVRTTVRLPPSNPLYVPGNDENPSNLRSERTSSTHAPTIIANERTDSFAGSQATGEWRREQELRESFGPHGSSASSMSQASIPADRFAVQRNDGERTFRRQQDVGIQDPSPRQRDAYRSTPDSLETPQFRKLSLSHVRTPQLSQQTIFSAFSRQQSAQPSKQTNGETVASPFTYLALLQKRFLESGSSQAGRVKGVLSSVKEFHFRNRDVFRLSIYIDDGSLVTEALMDHQLVQSLVGNSPAEVTAALDGGPEFMRIKAKMKEFQAFLTGFQGYMDIEFSDTVKVLNVHQSIQLPADAWMLLNRVKIIPNLRKRIEIDLTTP